MEPMMLGDIIRRPIRPEPVVLRWTLECGHDIICDCDTHYVGKQEYCSKCNAWRRLRIWRRYVPETTGDN